MINLNSVYRNTCCMCCGIPQVSSQYFLNLNSELVKCTIDHDLLRSLGGSNSSENLNLMCHDCNQLRSNLFAELDEFIDWYKSGEVLPKKKNFSYLYENPKNKKRNYKMDFTFAKNVTVNVPDYGNTNLRNIRNKSLEKKTIERLTPELPSKQLSVPTRIVEMNGTKYQEYKHPLFGLSLIKIENLKDDRVAA